ncbi:ABC1 kinase family protein [Rhabdothermincola salaria]|uniref:ABC1 kinase family protein n=1 Tax=Rhabdothermincola salaria TaxID=2903142 RepID=UPI001E5D081C|nr:AarF/UbiB family protein [Rhabdothermincola salaria]MCD9625000.1 AarF/UbiB family protein [Rhabdothermincola salaria]
MAVTPPTEPLSRPEDDAPNDLSIGAFSDDPPWLVDPEVMPWREAVDAVRWVTRAQLPDLIRPRRLPRGRRVFTVVRRLGTALLPWYLIDRRKGRELSRAGLSRRLRIAAEHLGPTYIKLGQIISSGEGLFPEELVTEFKKCRDQVPPQPFRDVRTIIETDFGRPLEDVFAAFERTPLAAASIAQVHAATLHTGEQVVVKVQRRTVGERVHADLEVMAWLAPFLVGRIPIAALANPPALVELFAETITEELDFRLEAQNMLDVAASFVELGQRGYVVPRPHPELVTPRVLVMERLDGFNFDDVAAMKDAGVDTHAVVRTGMIGFMEGALICGIFHGDLHGGNLFVMADGRTALLDFGITGRMGEAQRLAFLRLLLGATTNDVRTQLAALRDLGALPLDTDLEQVIVDLDLEGAPIDPTSLTPDEMIHEIQRVVKLLLGYGARMPKELMLYVKNLVFLDGAIARLAPDLDLFAEITSIAMHFTQTHGQRIFTDIGVDAAGVEFDFTGVKAGFGVDPGMERLTYRELQARRELIRSRFEDREVS